MAFATLAASVAVRPALLSRPALPQRRAGAIRATRAARTARVVPATMTAKVPKALSMDAEKIAAMGALSALTMANPVLAATNEVAQIADDRLGIFFLLFGPVLGWVGFNILGPALNQLDKMDAKNKGVIGAVGLSAAALATAPGAEAATEVAQIADDRLGIFFLLFGPVLGWVGFNILGPALNQLDKMDAKNKGVIGAVGLSAAALATAPGAQAATEVAQIADDRLGIFFLLFGPVLGWVGFNILGPALNQLDKMDAKNK